MSDSASKPKTKTVTIPVRGMGCGECAEQVKKSLEALDGVAAVEVINWLDSARVVCLEEHVTPGCMVDSIKELGYEVGEPKEEIYRVQRREPHFRLLRRVIEQTQIQTVVEA